MKLQQLMKQLCVGTGIGVAALALTACGGGHHSQASTPVIIVSGGYWGYYDGVNFCDWVNDYCDTGLAYGITSDGLYYDGEYISGGSGGYTSGGYTSGGSGGYTSGGYTSGGSGGYTSGGYTSGGYTSGGYTSGGYTSGGYTSGGTTSDGSITGGIANSTTDTSLMQAMVNMANVDNEANALVTQFPMNFEAARQLVQLGDKMQILEQNHQLTNDDRDAIASAALAVGHVSQADVANAMAKYANGDQSALTNVELKYAQGVGLPDQYIPMVRDQIFPKLGISTP